MRVLLDTTFARGQAGGTGVYVRHLVDALRRAGIEVVETHNERRGMPGAGASKRNLLSDLAFTHVVLPRRARRARVDLVHHPLPLLIPKGRIPQVVTVHDLAFEALPDAFDPRFAAFARRAHRAAARRANAVVAVSRATARDVKASWGVDAVVAPHGPGQDLGAVRRSDEPGHFLYVGDAEPRKDVPLLLEAYARYRMRARRDARPLVLAGRALSVDSGVRVVERPTPRQLAELHAAAVALVHPSRHEGFGLTVAEAVAAGTPVIAADTAAIREIAPEASLFAPGDAGALARLLEEPPTTAAGDPARLSWERSARAHIDAYRLALSA